MSINYVFIHIIILGIKVQIIFLINSLFKNGILIK